MRSRRVPEVVPNASELSSASPGVELGYFRQRSGTSGSARALPAALGYFRPFPALLRCQVRKTAILELSRSGFICAEKGEIEGRNWAVGSRGEHLSGKIGLLDQKKRRIWAAALCSKHCKFGGVLDPKRRFFISKWGAVAQNGDGESAPHHQNPKKPSKPPKVCLNGVSLFHPGVALGILRGVRGPPKAFWAKKPWIWVKK